MSPQLECPVCHLANRPGARACEECGWDFMLNRPGKARRGSDSSRDVGLYGLALGTVVSPVRTMDAFFYYVNDTAMLGKMAIFYLASLPIAGFIAGGGESDAWVKGTLAEAVGFAVSLVCIIGAGRLLGQSGSIAGAAVILGFVRAVVTFILGLYVLAIVVGLTGPNFIVFLIFLVWNVVLNIVALTNIFGCSAGVAFFISIIAGLLQGVVTRHLGVGS
ncbi:MAG TPA: hypothetical protein VFC86_13320 [Planctomycetota bacterium]|nr:hypothetical protein [Planctomycetota bacterium]